MDEMTESKVADLIQDLVIPNCIDVEEEDRSFPEVEEITSIENSPYSATVMEEGCYMTFPNGQKFLIYVKEC